MKIQFGVGSTQMPFAKYSPVIADAVSSATTKYAYLVPRGWKFILHASLDIAGTKGNFEMKIQSNKGGGSFAEAKMKTLEKYRPRCTTGGDSLEYISGLLESYGPFQDETIPEQIRKLKRVGDMTREQHEWLRDNLGYTNFYGAFEVPCQYLTFNTSFWSGYEENNPALRLAFSGASEEQDTMFCAIVLRELQNHLGSGGTNTFWKYDLSNLRDVPNILLWLDRLGITEVPELS